jgi:acetyl-CoA carboxylase carboxyl transferase subunit alpha
MLEFGLIDGIVPEPIGGAHWDYNEAAMLLKAQLIKTLAELREMAPQERVSKRIEKYNNMGFYDEIPAGVYIREQE